MALKVITLLIVSGIVIKTFIGLDKKSTAEVGCNLTIVCTLAALITKCF